MKRVETEPRSWDDLIFEKRNHEYGAYAVRKAYPSNVNRATIVTLGLAAAIAACSFVATNKRIIPDIPIPHPPTRFEPEVLIIPTTPLQPPAKLQQKRGNLPPVATANPIEEKVLPNTKDVFQGGSDIGDDIEFADGSLSGVPIAEPVALPAAVDDKVYVGGTEVAAEYKGGMEALFKFVSRNIKYPAVARRLEVEGTVYVSFVVGKSGEILDGQVIKGIDAACDAEALRVIKLLRGWSPAMQGGVPVKVRMVLPITFKLNR